MCCFDEIAKLVTGDNRVFAATRETSDITAAAATVKEIKSKAGGRLDILVIMLGLT